MLTAGRRPGFARSISLALVAGALYTNSYVSYAIGPVVFKRICDARWKCTCIDLPQEGFEHGVLACVIACADLHRSHARLSSSRTVVVPQKGTFEVVAVDHVEHPSEN